LVSISAVLDYGESKLKRGEKKNGKGGKKRRKKKRATD